MYKRNNTFGGFRPNRDTNRNQIRPRDRFKTKIDPALFVKKADEITKIEETETLHSFADFNLNDTLLLNIKEKGFIKPTPIQDQIISPVLEGRDVLGLADTGTGKTAAFAIPLIEMILKNPQKRVIILAPTRELAQQIKQDFRSLLPNLRVYLALAIGGAYLREQIQDIKRDPHIIVGTPGRIKDLGKRRVINFNRLDTIVLDEVDRMLDMGFMEDIKEIIDHVNPIHQTLFFSATVDKKISLLIDGLLNNPVKVSINSRSASTHVDQDVVKTTKTNKFDKLCELLAKPEFSKILVFRSTKREAEELALNINKAGFNAGSIHGDKKQYQRQVVLKSFKENQINILVATDVAARGLDIADITHVINYDLPNNYQDYIHRIGRTGRGNSKGCALTFIEEHSFHQAPRQNRNFQQKDKNNFRWQGRRGY